jgi:hypothetical protein
MKDAPKLSGLSESCARVVWYTLTDYDAATRDPEIYEAKTKIWVPKKDAEAFFLSLPGLVRNQAAEAGGYYAGKWNYTQLCDIEKSKLVSLMSFNGGSILTAYAQVTSISTVPKPVAAPKGSPPAGKGTI